MRTIIFIVFFITSVTVYAQRECTSHLYADRVKSLSGATAERIIQAEDFIKRQQNRNTGDAFKKPLPAVIKIPVVVHVLYNSPEQNVSDQLIKSQLEALNRDFRRRNADSSKTPAHFKHLAADVQIEFYLATADPKGRATSGVIRKYSGNKEWTMDDKIKFKTQGGSDGWDSKSYLNIWVGPMRRTLGYSSVVGGPSEKDGVVINTSAFGVTSSGKFNLGRTLVHEVGHWLGLRHLWGDDYCGDDLVGDTPKQSGYNVGCPSGIVTSSCDNSKYGEMFMNYMDFVDDACMNLFTQGQKERMRAAFIEGGPRSSLLESKGLNEPWMADIPAAEEPEAEPVPANKTTFSFYPNPVTSDLILNFNEDNSWAGKEIRIINLNGVVVQKVRIVSKMQKIDLSLLKSGMYFINGSNGQNFINEKFIKTAGSGQQHF